MFKILDEACTPTRGTKYSAAVDLRAREDVTIAAGETKLIPLGIKLDLFANDELFMHYPIEQLKKNCYLQLMLRSGLGKKGLILPTGVGVIDLDYQDEIMMIIHNSISGFDENFLPTGANYPVDRNTYEIKKGDRVGQIILLEHKSYLFGIDTDEVRAGGFGSTGTK
jgi:dUTP pyrophosphatase